MGFDNECIPNIQSLPGEYFCPVCRQLVYPNEAIQTQCTHLYCKPCLTYIVSTTRACPYDGYLVTEADSKPLIESNKTIAEAIGRIPVYCLYHRSGCTWQGSFSECTTHCTSCPYGSSPVVCNRCGTQIVHRQVQEHAQNCPGTQPLQQEGSQALATSTATVELNQAAAPSATQAGGTTSQVVAVQTVPDQSQVSTNVQSQPTSVVPTPEQWYQQYQQYYQQYPQYQQYQQHFMQYDQYQQHVQQYQPQLQIQPQGQSNAQSYLQPQAQSHSHGQPQAVPHVQQTHVQANAQPQVHTHGQPPAQPAVHQQSQANQPQPQPQTQQQTQPQAQPQTQSQLQSASQQPQTQVQGQAQALVQPQTLPQSQPQTHVQSQQLHQAQPQPQPQPQPSQQTQPQTQPHLLPQQVLPQPHPPAHSHPYQQHPYPQPQVQSHQHAYPQPQPYGQVQQQLPPSQPQHQQFPHQQGHLHAYPQSNLHPQHQPQMQQTLSAHQSYPQAMQTPVPQPQHQQQAVPMHPHQQNSSVQHSTQLPAQQQPVNQSLPHQMPVPVSNQFPSQQMRAQNPPLQPHGSMQHQQHPPTVPMQAHHPHAPPQQQPHMAPHQSAQPVPQGHGFSGVQPAPQQQTPVAQFHQQPQIHPQTPQYPGLPPKVVNNYQQQAPLFPAQQSLRPHGPSAIQQHPPAQVPLNHNMLPSSQVTPPQQFTSAAQGAAPQHHVGRPMPNHGMQQQLLQQTPGGLLMGPDARGPVRPSLSNAGQQLSPVQNMPKTSSSLIPEQQKLSFGQNSSSQPASVAGPQSGGSLNQANVAANSMIADMKQEMVWDQTSEPPLCIKSSSADATGTSESDSKHDGSECKVSKSLNNMDSLIVKEKGSYDVRDEKVLSVQHTVSEVPDSSSMHQKDAELHGHSDDNANENPSSRVNAPEELLEPSANGNRLETNGVMQGALKNDSDAQGEDNQEVSVDGKDPEKDSDTYKEKDAVEAQKSQKSQEVNGNVKGSESTKLTSGPQPVEDAVGVSQALPGHERNCILPQVTERNSFMASQRHAIGGPDKSMLQHHPQMMGPMYELKAPQSGFPDRSLQPLSQHVPLDETHTMSHLIRPDQSQMQANSFLQPAHPFPAPNDKQLQQFPLQQGPPYVDRGMQVQRPPLQPMAHSGPNMDRRFPEPPHQVPVHGQFPPSHRHQGTGPFENFSQHGLQVMPDRFQLPAKQQVLTHTSLSNEPNNFSGPSPFGRVDGSIPLHGHIFPPHAAGPKGIPMDPVAGASIGPSHPGIFDSPGGLIPHGPVRGPDGQLGRPPPKAVERADGLPSQRPGFVEGWQPDIRPPLSADRPLMGQPSGFQPGKGPVFPQLLPDERKSIPGEMFKPPRDEPFKPFPGEHFRSFPHDPSKRNIDRKEFEEDLKKFPRPGHLDGERGPQHDDFFLSSRHQGGPMNFENSRNMEGGIHGFGRDSALKVDAAGVPPRPFGSFPSSSDNFDRKADQVGSRSDFVRPVQEFGRPHIDGFPRSPGRDFGGLSRHFVGGSPGGLSRSLDDYGGKEAHAIGERAKSYNLAEDFSSFHGRKPPVGDFDGQFPPFPSSDIGFGAINESFGPGSLPLHLRRDIPGHLRSGEPIGPRFGESPGLFNPHSHLRVGDAVGPAGFPNHLRFGEPFYSANLPPHLGIGESLRGEGSYYNPLLRQHEMDPLDHPRKRKPSGMGWCRICQMDCETVEGLDLHSQTREHQKRAMDMVMSIKQDTAKKQKLSSEDRLQDDTVRSKKSNFEDHGNKN
ncbi:unnamed protein product [Victoria cruziana]